MDGFKQRLIGALVLISLAVIFVPMLLDEPHEERSTRSIEIPEEPDFPEVRIEPAPEPQVSDAIAPVPEPENPPMQTGSSQDGDPASAPMNAEDSVGYRIEEVPQADPAPVEPADEPVVQEPAAAQPPDAPVAVAEPEPTAVSPPAQEPLPESGGFLVQLGSFGSSSNANALKGSVEDAGFTAHVTRVESNGQTFTRVFAGPFAAKDTAEAAKATLDKQFGLNTLVVVNDD